MGRRMRTYRMGIGFLILALILLIPLPGLAEKIRKSEWDGEFYPRDPAALKQLIKNLTAVADKDVFTEPSGNRALRALIIPHAGYAYSGFTTAHVSKLLKGKPIQNVILLGPDHQMGFHGCAVSGYDAWSTPLGTVPVDIYARTLRKEKPDRFKLVPKTDDQEHSLENALPFLQSCLTDFKVTPVIVSQDDPDELARDLLSLIPIKDNPGAIVIVSTDLSHYLTEEVTALRDRKTIDMILKLDEQGLKSSQNAACGILPIMTLVKMAKTCKWKPFLIHYSNSASSGFNKHNVVGYAAIAFYGGITMKPDAKKQPTVLSEEQGSVLVKIARRTIANQLGKKTDEISIPDDPVFKSRRGTFVTLKINNELRGCIGNLSGDDAVTSSVRRNALNAAFSDYRFSPLTPDELGQVDIEVSVLNDAAPLRHEGGKDLLSKLTPFKDGVIIRKGGRGATFLPQVWDQLPSPETFMTHLCMKAGLPADEWTRPGLEVSVYQVQYFEEKKQPPAK